MLSVERWKAYEVWFATEGSVREMPLGSVTWTEDRRVLERIERAGHDLERLTVSEAKAFLVRRLRKDGVGPGAVNHESTALARWFGFRDGERPKLPRWKEPEPREKALTAEEEFAVLGYVHENRIVQLRARAIVLFALSTGTEPAEACMVDVADVDFAEGGVYVRHPSKGHASGFIPLRPNALSNPRRPSLHTWLRNRPDAQDGALFTSLGMGRAQGAPRRMTPAAMSQVLQAVGRQVGVELNWFVTRHTFGTNLVEAGYPLRYVQKLLRLKNLNHVARYAEARRPLVVEKFRRLEGIDPYRGGR